MRVRIDLQKSIVTPGGTYRYITGEWDAANGIVWLDQVQGGGRKVPPGLGVHLASRMAVTRLADAGSQPAKAKPGQPREAA